MFRTVGYATNSAKGSLKPHEFVRKDVGPSEVLIDIKYCGVCHSDVHQARNEWSNTVYPCMPGHEIIGVVEKVGKNVTNYKAGDLVGVGCMIDSCQKCDSCLDGLEQYCKQGATMTYNGNLRFPKNENNTYGGYSNKIVVADNFVLRIPEGMEPEAVAPILCAGITTYSPLKFWKVSRGSKVGVVGVGGLGHMAIKIAVAMGAEVTAITSHERKVEDAKRLGATKVVVSTDAQAMKDAESSLDFILSTIPESHDVNPYTQLLKRDGVLTIVGCIAPTSKPLDLSKMVMDRRILATSLIGSVKETQEVLDFCAKHNILPDTKLIEIDEINKAFDELDRGDVDYRFVIDMSSLEKIESGKGLLEKIGFTPKDLRVPH